MYSDDQFFYTLSLGAPHPSGFLFFLLLFLYFLASSCAQATVDQLWDLELGSTQHSHGDVFFVLIWISSSAWLSSILCILLFAVSPLSQSIRVVSESLLVWISFLVVLVRHYFFLPEIPV